ncbi:MAG: hypothetical protein ABIP94_25205, partial [Planctomycetota bacterium]
MKNPSLLLISTVLLAVSCSTVGGQGYVRSPYSKNVWIRPAGASSYWIKADQGVLPWDSLFLAA